MYTILKDPIKTTRLTGNYSEIFPDTNPQIKLVENATTDFIIIVSGSISNNLNMFML